jgi:hypothetical protein
MSDSHGRRRPFGGRPKMASVSLVALLVTLGLASCGGGGGGQATGPARTLLGTFDIQPGKCPSAHKAPTGSFLVIVNSAGGKTVANPAGGCANKFYTPLTPGLDKGIMTGQFQANPTPTFDAHSNSLANAVIQPVSFLGVKFGMGTSANDVQDDPAGSPTFAPPRAVVRGTKLSIDLRSLNITYGGPASTTCVTGHGFGCWNLGSRAATGSYDPKTHDYVVQWFVGETFTQLGDSMIVRFEGKFVPHAKGAP